MTANTYTYVNGDPVSGSDPSGHATVTPDGDSVGNYKAQERRDDADAANQADADRQGSRDERLYGQNDRNDYLNARNRGKAAAVALAQTYQLTYDVAQHEMAQAAASREAAAAGQAAQVKAASRHHCASYNFACHAVQLGEGEIDALTSVGAGAVNCVV